MFLRFQRLRRTLIHTLAVAAIVVGCGSNDTQEPADDTPEGEETASNVLTIYSMRSERLAAPAIEAFRAANPEIEVVARWGGAELVTALIEEGTESRADVFLAEEAGTLGVLEGRSLFAVIPPELVENVPTMFRSGSRRWVGMSGRARVIAYNTSRMRPDQLPTNVDGFTEEAWRGRVGWVPDSTDFQAFVAAMIQLRGRARTEAWLRAMKANEPREFPSNAPALMAVSRGEIDVAFSSHFYLHRLRADAGPSFAVDNHYVRDGSAAALINVSGAGILENAPNADAARRFVTFLLSEEGQRLFVRGNHELPVVAGVASPDELPGIQTLRAPALRLAQLSDTQATQALLRETGVLP